MARSVDTAIDRPGLFISYARADSSALAEELVTGLELAGFAPYLDRNDILPVVGKPVPDSQVPERPRNLNYIVFREGRSFARPLSSLAEALRQDVAAFHNRVVTPPYGPPPMGWDEWIVSAWDRVSLSIAGWSGRDGQTRTRSAP